MALFLVWSYFISHVISQTWQTVDCESNQYCIGDNDCECRCTDPNSPCFMDCVYCEQHKLYGVSGQDMEIDCAVDCYGVEVFVQDSVDVTYNCDGEAGRASFVCIWARFTCGTGKCTINCSNGGCGDDYPSLFIGDITNLTCYGECLINGMPVTSTTTSTSSTTTSTSTTSMPTTTTSTSNPTSYPTTYTSTMNATESSVTPFPTISLSSTVSTDVQTSSTDGTSGTVILRKVSIGIFIPKSNVNITTIEVIDQIEATLTSLYSDVDFKLEVDTIEKNDGSTTLKLTITYTSDESAEMDTDSIATALGVIYGDENVNVAMINDSSSSTQADENTYTLYIIIGSVFVAVFIIIICGCLLYHRVAKMKNKRVEDEANTTISPVTNQSPTDGNIVLPVSTSQTPRSPAESYTINPKGNMALPMSTSQTPNPPQRRQVSKEGSPRVARHHKDTNRDDEDSSDAMYAASDDEMGHMVAPTPKGETRY